MRALALALLLVACAAARPVGPTAVVRLVAPQEWSADDRARIADGLSAWRELGFDTLVEAATDLPRCPNNWMFTRRVDCHIAIGLRRELQMDARYGVRALTDRATDSVSLDSRIHGDELAHVIAHELGHVLLNTGKHTTHGVMVTGGWMWALSAKDRALACEAIGRGCK
jgi:hypothetical protein